MNAFGWFYAILTIVGIISIVNEIDKPRKPVTRAEVGAKIILNVLLFLALYHWGLR